MSMRAQTRHHPARGKGFRGYVLIESLTALAVLGVGLLPLAALAPAALSALRQYETLGQATRAAAELAELEDPGLTLSPLHACCIGSHQLRFCRSLASAGSEHGHPGCAAGSRLAVVGLLPRVSGQRGGVADKVGLRVIALWIRP